MMHALIFPGQGSQYIGMGKSLYAASSASRAVFDEIDDAIDFALSALMFDGDAETLRLTENVQPALMAVSVAMVRLWIERAAVADVSALCGAVAGHSLGEYSALTATGAITLADAARTLKARGAVMQKAVPVGKGGMVAVLGLEVAAVTAFAAEIAAEGVVCELANDNAAGQVVLSGAAPAMDAVVARAKAHGAKHAVPLPVSAPFHCSMMGYARDAMREYLADLAIAPPVVPCYANVDTTATQDPAVIRQNLIDQVCAPVRWRCSVLRMAQDGAGHFVEVGAGKVLSGLVKRIVPKAKTTALQELDDLENFLSA
ncbi:MAG: ACP S-malonyltransferase [Alphaproteobacteria bacterium]|nr:ACP S-malonyltransferase [Alphaproteobacteria bacterium]